MKRNNESQFRVEQVLDSAPQATDNKDTASANNPNAGKDTTTATTTATDTDTTTNNDGKDTTTNTDTTNKPIVVLMNQPNKTDPNQKGAMHPSDVVYYGVMTAIFIALLAVAYNSVKTANIAKSK